MDPELIELCSLDVELYRCVSEKISTDRVVLTNKSVIHMANHHPEAYNDVLIALKETIKEPDYIFRDDNHEDTGLVIKEIEHGGEDKEHSFVVLKICTDTKDGQLANSVISGWKIGDKRLQSYLRNKRILYKKS